MKISQINYAVLDQGIISGTNFLLSFFLARYFSPEQFGLYIFAFTSLILSVGLLNSTVNVPMSVMGSQLHGDEWSDFLYNTFLHFAIIALVLAALFFVLHLYLDFGRYHLNSVLLRDISAVIFICLLQEYVRRILLTKLKVRDVFTVDFITYIPRILVVLFCVETLNASRMIYLFGITALFGSMLGYFYIRKDIRSFSVKKEVWKKVWHYGKWTLADWAPFVLTGQFYVYIVTFVLGNSANGILGACRNFIAPISIVLVSLMNYALPYYSRLYNNQGQQVLITSMKKVFSIFGALIIIYLLSINIYSKPLMELLFRSYSEYNYLVIFLSIGIFFNFIFKPVDIYFKVKMLPKKVFYCRAVTAIVTLITIFPLIRWLGVLGAACSYIISQFTMCVLMFYMLLQDKKEFLAAD